MSRFLRKWFRAGCDHVISRGEVQVDTAGGKPDQKRFQALRPRLALTGLLCFLFSAVVGLAQTEPALTLVSPNGGEVVIGGQSIRITWTSRNVTGNVVIELLQNGSLAGVIAPSVPVASGEYSWIGGRLASGTQVSGTGFKVRLTFVPPPTSSPAIAAPVEVQRNTGPHTASISPAAGLRVLWEITGGVLLTPADGAEVQFQAGSDPYATLRCTVSNISGSVSSTRKVICLPFAPRNYLADFKTYLATYRDAIVRDVAKGDSGTYVGVGYYLQGLAAAAEVSGDTVLMDELVGYIIQMIEKAQSLVRNGITYKQWGPLEASGHPQQNNQFASTIVLARTAAIIEQNPVFKARYPAQFTRIVTFVDQSVFKYWFDKTNGVYASSTCPWPAGVIPWLSTELGGWGSPSYDYFVQHCMNLGIVATYMVQATRDPIYLDAATRIARQFKTNHLVATGGHWMWDEGKYDWEFPANQAGCLDTSHANRIAQMMMSMVETGIVFTAADLDMLARTFIDVIWNGSDSSPLFANYINGSNLPFREVTAPGGNGIIWHGWDMLGRYSPEVQRIMAITFQLIQTQPALNATIVANAESFGRVMISGTLARNRDTEGVR